MLPAHSDTELCALARTIACLAVKDEQRAHGAALRCRPIPEVRNRRGTVSDIAVFHYIIKSKEDYMAKMARGGGAGNFRKWSLYDKVDRCEATRMAAAAAAAYALVTKRISARARHGTAVVFGRVFAIHSQDALAPTARTLIMSDSVPPLMPLARICSTHTWLFQCFRI